jgi:hypothetical protein
LAVLLIDIAPPTSIVESSPTTRSCPVPLVAMVRSVETFMSPPLTLYRPLVATVAASRLPMCKKPFQFAVPPVWLNTPVPWRPMIPPINSVEFTRVLRVALPLRL